MSSQKDAHRAHPSSIPTSKLPSKAPANISANHFVINVPLPVLPDRLFWASVRSKPKMGEGEHWFSTEMMLEYQPFCADFGPMNLACVYRFNELLREKMTSSELKNSKIVYYTANTPQARSNGVFMLGAYLTMEEGMSPEEVCAWSPVHVCLLPCACVLVAFCVCAHCAASAPHVWSSGVLSSGALRFENICLFAKRTALKRRGVCMLIGI